MDSEYIMKMDVHTSNLLPIALPKPPSNTTQRPAVLPSASVRPVGSSDQRWPAVCSAPSHILVSGPSSSLWTSWRSTGCMVFYRGMFIVFSKHPNLCSSSFVLSFCSNVMYPTLGPWSPHQLASGGRDCTCNAELCMSKTTQPWHASTTWGKDTLLKSGDTNFQLSTPPVPLSFLSQQMPTVYPNIHQAACERSSLLSSAQAAQAIRPSIRNDTYDTCDDIFWYCMACLKVTGWVSKAGHRF